MKIKTIYYGLIVVALLATGALLLMVGPDEDAAPVGTPEQKLNRAAVSIFDQRITLQEKQYPLSRFTEPSGPAHPHNPVNPATGLRYTDADMARFELLRDEFPGNRMIPRRRTPLEVKQALSKEQKLARKYYMTTRIQILQGKAPQPVIDEYFDFRLRYTKDKVRLLQYALRNLPEDTPDARRNRIEKLLHENRLKLERALFQKRTAYKKSGIGAPARL